MHGWVWGSVPALPHITYKPAQWYLNQSLTMWICKIKPPNSEWTLWMVVRELQVVCPAPPALCWKWVISCAEHGRPLKLLSCLSVWSFADAQNVPKAENMCLNHPGKKYFQIYFGSSLYIHPSSLSVSGTLALLMYACKRKTITKSLFRKRFWSSDLLLNFTSWFPLAVMLKAVWNFLAAYPLAQHRGFYFVFVAQLVGREQKCGCGGACCDALMSSMNPTALLISVFSIELMAALLGSKF